MIISVHQPNFLPWIGYFHKIIHSDIFVLLDNVQIPRGRSVANRNKIKTAGGVLELVVPLSFPKGSERIATYREVSIADNSWKEKALKTLKQSYARADHFDEVHPFVSDCLALNSFFDMNYNFIHGLLGRVEINKKIVMLSDLENLNGKSNELILDICKKLGADVYLSGKGAASYNDPDAYKAAGIKLIYQQYEPIEYKQLHGPFIPNLSVVDMLYNIGFENTYNRIREAAYQC